jgi:hypothetical protein
MPTFFLTFRVVPTEHNPQNVLVEGALAHCWIVERSETAAYNKARFFVLKDEWDISSTDRSPVEVSAANFQGRDIGLAQFQRAQDSGIAITYVGLSSNGKSTIGPIPLERARHFDLNAYVGRQKKLTQKGRCLHFESGTRCGVFINAHSIQKSGQLSAIARDGHVYTLSKNIGALKKNDGHLSLERQGISKVSTFLGFCDTHDNQLFSPIDTWPLQPTGEQVFLYAYRSICRELFVKENALGHIDSQLADLPATSAARGFFRGLKEGASFGLKNLLRHKEVFDDSLKADLYSDVEYVLFTSVQEPSVAFSGLFFPEFDFLGRHLQNLADHRRRLDLLTFCSAPVADGWGFLFAWHRTSSAVCTEFMRSLATVIHEKSLHGGDAMFRMVISSCENLAIAPAWWEGLAADQRAAVTARLSDGADIFTPTDPEYLTRGLEGICRWEFGAVYAAPERMPHP